MGMPNDNSTKISLDSMLYILNQEHIPYEITEVEESSLTESEGDFKLEAVLPLILVFNAKEDEIEGKKLLYSMRLNIRKEKEAREQGFERGYEVFEQ